MFGADKLTKNADSDKNSYSGYVLNLILVYLFEFQIFIVVKSLFFFIKFGVDNSSSVHFDNKKEDILILGKGPTLALDNTAITAEAEYTISYSRLQTK